jgi:hypothetical protein
VCWPKDGNTRELLFQTLTFVYLPHGIREHGTFAEKEKFALDLIKMFNGGYIMQNLPA